MATASDVARLARELRALGTDDIVDIQGPEYVLSCEREAARLAEVPPTVLADLERRLLLTDKLQMS